MSYTQRKTSLIETADTNLTSLIAMLETPRFELIPLTNALDQAEHLPQGAHVSVTASPTKGLPATIELASAPFDLGFAVVPHLSARLIRDRYHLSDIVATLKAMGTDHAFEIAGDSDDPVGYFDSVELLHDLDNIEHGLKQIGIFGYPESHPKIQDQDLLAAPKTNQSHASYITTQMRFAPAIIKDWIGTVRTEGIDLPIRVGIPEVARIRRLISISAKIGVGDSVRFLTKTGGAARKLVRLGGYAPDELLRRLLTTDLEPAAQIEGLNIYTFNDIENTERWRLGLLETTRAALESTRS